MWSVGGWKTQRLMSKRFWGLSRRQTLVAVAIAVLVGVVLAFALPRGDDSASNPRGSNALWAFGFATVRIDPKTLTPSRHPLPKGFGSVLSTPGRAYLFEPSDGRVGVLDASRNTLKVIGQLPPGVDEPATVDPLIANTPGHLWLVHKPGTVTQFDLATRRASGSVELSTTGGTGPPTSTRIVASGGAVVAVSEVAGGYALSRISATTRTEEKTQVIPADGPITGLTSDDQSVWIVTASIALQVDTRTLRVAGRIGIPPMAPQVPRGAAITRGALWTLGGNGSTLVRVDLATQRTTTALQILPSEPSILRGPASVISGDGRVWVMVQRTNDPKDHSVRIAGVTAATGKPTKGADLPTELFIGAIAVT